jgi:hypothetical protein
MPCKLFYDCIVILVIKPSPILATSANTADSLRVTCDLCYHSNEQSGVKEEYVWLTSAMGSPENWFMTLNGFG